MNDNKPCRQELMNRINAASFAVDDVKLFMDTHPCDKEAMEYFEKYQEMRKYALREYAKYYSPLTIDTVRTDSCENWNWIDEPWPWQEGGC